MKTPMTEAERDNLALLAEIADETDTPLTQADRGLIDTLERTRCMSPAQAEWFDDLVARHLEG